MRYFFCALMLALAFTSKAQLFNEKLLNNDRSNICLGAISLGEDLFFANSPSDYYLGWSTENVIYKSNEQIHILDSINLADFYGFDSFQLQNFCVETDTTFLVVGVGIIDTPHAESLVVASADQNLNIAKSYTNGLISDSIIVGMTATWADTLLYVGGFQFGTQRHPAYFVFNKNGVLINKTVFKTLGNGTINSIYYKRPYVYAGFRLSSQPLVLRIKADDFSVDSLVVNSQVLSLPYVSISGFYSFNDSSDSFYAYGEHFLKYLGLYKIDTTLKVSAVDTFASVSSPSYPISTTVAERGILDAKDERSIFFATSEGSYFLPSQLQSGLISNMKLWRVDTGGNVIWSVVVNDSSYYLPTKTVATSDGGAVFFSMKYDWRKDVAPKTDLSIIKLDSNGSFVGLHEMEIPYQKPLAVSVYPNPSVDEISLSGVELRELAAILVYTVDGVLVKEVVNPQSLTVSMDNVAAGTYVIHTLHKNGMQGIGKVIKGK